ncbi:MULTISPECIES: hypothetical protein [Streptomyces]|uniref:hypothetical protein n=1 Tax=Streptomyces TaxID=1883 RepID=UPI00345B8555
MTDTHIEQQQNCNTSGPFHVPLPPEAPEPEPPWWTKPPGDLLGSEPEIPPKPDVPPMPSQPPTVGVEEGVEDETEAAVEAAPGPSPLRRWAVRVKTANAAAKQQRRTVEEYVEGDVELPVEAEGEEPSPSRRARRLKRLRALRQRDDDQEPESEPQHQRRYEPAHSSVVHETWHALQPVTRGLLYNGAAAWIGWELRIFGGKSLGVWELHFFESAGRETSITTATVVALIVTGVVGWKIDRPTRHWFPPLAWLCRVPLATTVVALGFANTNR